MGKTAKSFENYVEHPRFGKGPRFTGVLVNVSALVARRTFRNDMIVDGTAVKADLSKQSFSVVPVTHYYDLDCLCVECHRRFIFFAQEQKHWYEVLKFNLKADCVRCPECRKSAQALGRKVATYERLLPKLERTPEETRKLIDCTLDLVGEGIFGAGRLQFVRALLKKLPKPEQHAYRVKVCELESKVGKEHTK